MSWKPLHEIYLNESAFKQVPKLPRQQVYQEATAKEVINLIQDLDKQGLLNDGEDLDVVKKFLSQKPYASNISEYLTSHNLTPSTISEGNIQKMIMDVLSYNDDIGTYAKYIQNPVPLESIGNSGMLIDKIKKVSGLKDSTTKALINLIGTESGRGVGRGEIALASIFSDVKMSNSKGDLDWNGEYLEVKATSARLGKRDRASTNFERTALGKLAIQYDKSDKRVDTLVANLANEPGLNHQQLRNSLQVFVRNEYPHSNIQIDDSINLNDPTSVRNTITKIYFNNYAMHEGVDSFIFINTSRNRYFSRYVIFKKDEISNLIDKNLIKSGVITTLDLDPSIGTI